MKYDLYVDTKIDPYGDDDLEMIGTYEFSTYADAEEAVRIIMDYIGNGLLDYYIVEHKE